MNRRGFMGSILALGAAPAIVRADALMRVRPRDDGILANAGTPVFFQMQSIDAFSPPQLLLCHPEKDGFWVRAVDGKGQDKFVPRQVLYQYLGGL